MQRLTSFLLLYLFTVPTPAFSQDTILQRILALPDDTVKIDQLNEYSHIVVDTNFKKARALYEQSLALSTKLNYPAGAGAAWLAIGYTQSLTGNYQESIRSFYMGVDRFLQAHRIDRASRCLTNIGAMYEVMGRPDSAMASYMQAVHYLENTTDYVSLGNVYCSIGILHGNTKNYSKAITYKTKALAMARQQQDTALLIETLTELADTYGEMNEPAKGLPLAYEALPLALALKKDVVLGTAYYTLSALQLGLHHADSAIWSARRSMHHSLKGGDETTYLVNTICLSDGYALKNQQKERLAILKSALQKATRAGVVMLLDDIYKKMADANYELGNYQQAYLDYANYSRYQDSVLNEKKDRTVSELQVKYETAQKEKALSQKQLQLTQKDLQIQKSRNYLYYTIGGLMVALLAVALVLLQARHKKLTYARHLESLQQQKELQLLQAVMQGEERERGRIAKDLHDGVAGMLAAVKMHFSSLAPD